MEPQLVDPAKRRFPARLGVWRKSITSIDLVNIEIERARRHGTPLSVVVLDVPQGAEHDLRRVIVHHTESVRTTDVVVRINRGLLYAVVLPECQAEGARLVGSRITSQLTRGANGAKAAFGVAEFGQDGFVLEDLIDRARCRIFKPSIEPIVMGDSGARMIVKRSLDLAVCTMLFPFFLVCIPLVALAVRLDSPGPILFRQTRTGHRGRRFTMYKFRTTYHDADAPMPDPKANGRGHLDTRVGHDPHVTRVGWLLRRTSLDELPQIYSVLKGDMTLVGPRPISFCPEAYDIWHTVRLEAVPGITGLWQVSGRSNLDIDEGLHLDIEYVRRMSLGLDLRILARTLPTVLSGQGAH